MSDNNVTETRLDRIATAGWGFAGYAVGTLAMIIAIIHIKVWFFP